MENLFIYPPNDIFNHIFSTWKNQDFLISTWFIIWAAASAPEDTICASSPRKGSYRAREVYSRSGAEKNNKWGGQWFSTWEFLQRSYLGNLFPKSSQMWGFPLAAETGYVMWAILWMFHRLSAKALLYFFLVLSWIFFFSSMSLRCYHCWLFYSDAKTLSWKAISLPSFLLSWNLVACVARSQMHPRALARVAVPTLTSLPNPQTPLLPSNCRWPYFLPHLGWQSVLLWFLGDIVWLVLGKPRRWDTLKFHSFLTFQGHRSSKAPPSILFLLE